MAEESRARRVRCDIRARPPPHRPHRAGCRVISSLARPTPKRLTPSPSTTMRSTVLATLLCAALASFANAQALRATLVQSGFGSPIFVCSPPGDLQRLFVVEQGGMIKIIKNGGTLPTPFINLGA